MLIFILMIILLAKMDKWECTLLYLDKLIIIILQEKNNITNSKLLMK